ncbi:hypothetical protein GE061_010578 [Apolygus lucorum]|uniref:Mutator-like transposase domain-containing protein n=1 Tax=Apolygus lucorum TaxID=248454 RepID=A0A8S9XX69_APOLU|nr:hypothetical protein GE061_010578 [Apolygus lucorum]
MAPRNPKRKPASKVRSLKRLGQERIARLRSLLSLKNSGDALGNTSTDAKHDGAVPLSPVTAGSNPKVARRILFAHPNSEVGDSHLPKKVVVNVPVEISCQTPPPLLIEERSHVEENKREVTGRRIVDFNYIFNQLVATDLNHDRRYSCTLQNMKIIKERRDGLRSTFLIECNVCLASSTIESEPEANETNMDINQIVAASAVSIGVGHRQMEEIMGGFDIPFMTFSKFKKAEDEIGDTLHSVALTEALKIEGGLKRLV